ncbi:MAG TPA: PEGA domain-containing protein [Polyangia bacterium]|nr:PEGA domain-containing protein [Polyangia bacterium]
MLRLGKYQLDGRLGPEGVVESYRAHLADGGSRAAGDAELFVVKLLRADRVQRQAYPRLASRFIAAGRRLLAGSPAHPGQVFDVGEEEAGAFVVSGWVAGVDLVGLLQTAQQQATPGRAGVDPAVVGVVGGQMARVLSLAHAAEPPLFHLGLCPGNVLVSPTGEVVVRDFGLFASLRGLVDHPMQKWLFVAPELVGAAIGPDTLSGGAAADFHSLGALLHFLLGGKPPFEARSLAELSDRMREPVHELAGVSAALSAAICALTAPDPDDRPRGASLLSEALAGHPARVEAQSPVATKNLTSGGAGNDATVLASAGHVATRPGRAGVASRGAVAGRARSARSSWLVALVAFLGLLVVTVFGLLAFRLARTVAAKRAAQGVAIAQRRAGETPPVEPQLRLPSRQRSPESWLPAVPTPLPDAGARRAADAAPARALASDDIPVFPAGRFVVEESKAPQPQRVPNHLFVDTQPHGAQVWVEGVWKGNTPLDVLAGVGGKRLVLVAAGYHMFRTSVDAREGTLIRLALEPVAGPVRGDAFLNVVCRTPGRYPVFIDEVETGLLCPAHLVPVAAGTHRVAVFVPAERKLVAAEITATAGPKPLEVHLVP